MEKQRFWDMVALPKPTGLAGPPLPRSKGKKMRNVLKEIRLGGVWKHAPLQLYSLSLLRGDKGLGLMNLSNRLTTPGNENKNEHQCRSRKERSPRARHHAEGSREEPVWPSAQRRGISIGSHVLQRETLREGERPAQGPTDGSGEAGV